MSVAVYGLLGGRKDNQCKEQRLKAASTSRVSALVSGRQRPPEKYNRGFRTTCASGVHALVVGTAICEMLDAFITTMVTKTYAHVGCMGYDCVHPMYFTR